MITKLLGWEVDDYDLDTFPEAVNFYPRTKDVLYRMGSTNIEYNGLIFGSMEETVYVPIPVIQLFLEKLQAYKDKIAKEKTDVK